ncbi:Trehalose utilization [Rubripirellula lacrimiformis]|uniref:Trehalose utilization n=1 Tax=Rubripirellula lacrimiformis TaxID=1930273 RepID=A0A517N5B0_9BACT|nr:family 16 glycoside hydrolase [Rubripirellula lacrimiformis]QDT02303.1 Trehalose utilization [Rubripirellula lacrimiformis]
MKMTLRRFSRNAACLLALLPLSLEVRAADAEDAKPISVLLIDGQNNHKWQETTPVIKQTLEACGEFTVDVVTAPEKGGDMSAFEPKFDGYDVVVSNYNGEPWSEETQGAFESFVAGGKGFVSVHAADNSFPKWDAYNRMIGLGGWGGRNQKDGPYVRWKEDQQKFTRDMSPGNGGTHGKRVPFAVVIRDSDHPITRGLPGTFMQTADELYGKLRGPAENMHVLATGFSAPATGGTGEHEPLLMTVSFGEGRVFHTTLGHDVAAMQGVAFQATLERGTQWAATGDVTLPAVDAKTLTSESAAQRDPSQASAEPAVADSKAVPDIDADGWVSLFNATDLTGWTQKNGTATYRVEDGVIVGRTAEGSPNSFLCTEKDYSDFELTFEVMADPKLNTGVQIRSISKPEFKSGRVHGPQVEIEGAPGESGYIYSEGTGRLWITKDRPIDDALVNGQWNRYVIRASGDRLQTWVNGVAIADIRDPQSSMVGFIGLQVHAIKKESGPMEVRWRDLRIREL